MTLHIRGRVEEGNMGTGWISEESAAEAFAKVLQAEYEKAYPGADVQVEVAYRVGGGSAMPRAWDDDGSQPDEDDLWEFAVSTFAVFCENPPQLLVAA